MTSPEDKEHNGAYNAYLRSKPDQAISYSEDLYDTGANQQPVLDPYTSGDSAVTHFQQAQAQISELTEQNRKLKPLKPIAIILGTAAALLLIATVLLLIRDAGDDSTKAGAGVTHTVTQTENPQQPPASTFTETKTQTETKTAEPTTETKTETSVSTTTVTETADGNRAGTGAGTGADNE